METRKLTEQNVVNNEMKEVHFYINSNLYCIAKDPDTAFHLWKNQDDLKCTIEIDGKNVGDGWQARFLIEEYFNVSYKI